MLADKGRVGVEQRVRLAMAKILFPEAPLTLAVVFQAREIHLPHRDPVGTFLAATARAFDLTLVTADEFLLRGKGVKVLENR